MSVETWLRGKVMICDRQGLGSRCGCGEVKTMWAVCIARLRNEIGRLRDSRTAVRLIACRVCRRPDG
jgi:hypothetical protein